MTRIREVVEVMSGYASAVTLREDFLDAARNRSRMERYMPIRSHRAAFQRLAASVLPGQRKRSLLLTGPPGTGKSHLLLMLANYLHNASDQPEVHSFLDNWAREDRPTADALRGRRASGRWLVVVCDYGSNDSFEEILLRSITDACGPERENFPGIMVTHYHEALRLLDKWKDSQARGDAAVDLYTGFERTLSEIAPGTPLDRLRQGLDGHRRESLDLFKQAHRRLLDIDFTPSQANLAQILREFLSSAEFKARYQGMAVLFDEFHYMLTDKRVSLPVWQEFAEMCWGGITGMAPCLFVAAAHRSLESYARGWEDFAKESDRIDEVPLTAEGIEDLIGAMVQPKDRSAAWQDEVAPAMNQLNALAECKAHGVFPDLPVDEFTQRISVGAYPMHPMATWCLLKLAGEIGSANRTAFTFFTGELAEGAEGSFPWFLDSHEIRIGNKLQLYTVDHLVDYFAHEARSENKELRDQQRSIVSNYESSLRALGELRAQRLFPEEEIEDHRCILKAALALSLAGLPVSDATLGTGLFLTTQPERQKLIGRLETLRSKGILYRNLLTGAYDFRSANSVDIERMIEEYKEDPDNLPTNLASELQGGVAVAQSWPDRKELARPERAGAPGKNEEWIEARGYNTTYQEDRRAAWVFVRPTDLEAGLAPPVGSGSGRAAVSLFEYYDLRRQAEGDGLGSYEAVCLYVICESPEEIRQATAAAAKNPHDRVLVAIPRAPIPVRDTIMNLRATVAVRKSSEYTGMSPSDRAKVDELYGSLQAGRLGQLVKLRQRYLGGTECTWYRKDGRILDAKPGSQHAALDLIMQELFSKRCRISRADFNRAHRYSLSDNRSVGRNVALKDAAEALLDLAHPVKIDTSYGEDKGEIKYLRKALFDNEVLQQLRTTSPRVMECRVQTNEASYEGNARPLTEMVRMVRNQAEGDPIRVSAFVETFTGPPYGLGQEALLLFFACVVRCFGDMLTIKRDADAVGAVQLKSLQDLLDLILGQYPTACMIRRSISEDERYLLNGLVALFSGQSISTGDQKFLGDALDATADWWEGLPAAARILALYEQPADGADVALRLIETMPTRASVGASQFLFENLQTVCGFAGDDLIKRKRAGEILAALGQAKALMEGTPGRLEAGIAENVRPIFGVTDATYTDLKDGMLAWFHALDESQKYAGAAWQSSESKSLVDVVSRMDTLEKALFAQLPERLGLGAVNNWTADHSTALVERIGNAKKRVDENAIKVPVPEVSVSAGLTLERAGKDFQVRYRGDAVLTVAPPQGACDVLVSTTDQDPSRPGAQVEAVKRARGFPVTGGNQTFWMVSRDADDLKSPVLKVVFVDQDAKYRIMAPAQPLLPGQQVTVSIALPSDIQSLRTSIRSMVDSVIQTHRLEPGKAADELDAIARDLRSRKAVS